MKKTLITIATYASLCGLVGCSVQKTPNADLPSQIEGFYHVKNLSVGEEKIQNSKKNIFRVLKESDTEVQLLLLYYGKNPGFGSGIDQVQPEERGTGIASYYKGTKVATFYPKQRTIVSYQQGDVYTFKAKRFSPQKNARAMGKLRENNP